MTRFGNGCTSLTSCADGKPWGTSPAHPLRYFSPKETRTELTVRQTCSRRAKRGGPDGRPVKGEESPDSLKQRCRVTPGQSNLTESATENRLPSRLGVVDAAGKR